MTLENQVIIQKSINPIDASNNTCWRSYCYGRVSNLISGVLQVLFPGGTLSFTSCVSLTSER